MTPNDISNNITLPLKDLIWNILGNDQNGVAWSCITPTTALILADKLKDSLLHRVEFLDRDGNDLDTPRLWRYSEWKTEADTYHRQKLYQHNERVVRWLYAKNVLIICKALRRYSGIEGTQAEQLARKLLDKKAIAVLKEMGINKLCEREEDL
jgi:hypothetical protein